MHGYSPGHTDEFSESQRLCFTGNTFHCIVVARILSVWAESRGLLCSVPKVEDLWEAAGYGDGWRKVDRNSAGDEGDRELPRPQRAEVRVEPALPHDPGIHRSVEDRFYAYHDEYDDGVESAKATFGSEFGGESDSEVGEKVYHLVQ